MKESLGRIVAWAKAHPVIAVAIVAAVVVLGYLVYKRNAANAIPSGSTGTPDTGTPDLGIGSGIAGSGGGDTGNNVIPSTLPAIGPFTDKTPKGKSTPVGFSGDISLPTIDSNMFGGMFPGLDVVKSVATPYQSGDTGGKQGNSKAIQLPSNRTMQDVVLPVVSAPGGKAVSGAGKGGVAKGSVQAKGQTPAQQVGKGKNFTGYYNGTYYLNGYPASAPSVLPSDVFQVGNIFSSKTGNAPAVIGNKRY